jgi:hypothetical protein
MAQFDPAKYGPSIEDLLRRAPLNPLDAGKADATIRPALASLSDETIGSIVRDRDMAAACRAGLWLRFNYLDESHKISQDIDTPEGSFWHGILHRREGDFDNAKYWFRRVGMHPVFGPLQQEAGEFAAAGGKSWDPFKFVDLCAEAIRYPDKGAAFCQQIQQREWELLFDYCWQHAYGK